METGSANRAVVQTSMLHDPLSDAGADARCRRTPGWNGRAIFTLGGGCAGGWYRSGSTTGGVTDAFLLGRGYALMSSSLNVFGKNCNDLTAAESAMMTKELFVEHYGRPRVHGRLRLLGWFVPGASDHRQLPGHLRRHHRRLLVPGRRLRDGDVHQRRLAAGLVLHLRGRACRGHRSRSARWPASRRTRRCRVWRSAPAGSTRAATATSSPAAQRYDPVKNPRGVRCDVYDHTINAYGADPATGFARRPLDNVGVQYGLGVLKSGVITVDAVPRPERAGRRLRRGREPRAGPDRGRSAGGARGVPDRAADQRRGRA